MTARRRISWCAFPKQAGTALLVFLMALAAVFSGPGDQAAADIYLDGDAPFDIQADEQLGSAPVLSGTAYADTGSGEKISLDLRQVDLRDALSALAMSMGKNIILLDSPGQVDLKIENLTARNALELVIQKEGLSYVEQGNTIIVGEPGQLETDYYNQMILTRFETYFIPAARIQELLGELDVPQKNIILDENPGVIFVQGTVPALKKVSELINHVDTGEHQASLEHRSLELSFISPARAVELLKQAGIELTNHVSLDNKLLVFDRGAISRWDEVLALFQKFDSLSAREEKVLTFKLKNIYASTAAESLGKFAFGGEITPLVSESSKFSKDLLVICPPGLENTVRGAVVSIDKEQEKIKAVLLKMDHRQSVHSRRQLLSEMTGISSSSLHISNNLTGKSDSPEYILWAEETPENIELLKATLAGMK